MHSFVFQKHPQVLLQESPRVSGGNGGDSAKKNPQKTPEQIAMELERSRKIRNATSGKEVGQGDISNEQKKVDEFIKTYDIQKFKEIIYKQCIEHPLITNTWVFFNEYKELKGQVASFGNKLPPEYAIIIATMDNIRNSDIFARNTGKIDEAIQIKLGNGKKIEEFKQDMRSFLDMSIVQKKVLTMSDFDKQFDEKGILTPEEQKGVDDYAKAIQDWINKEPNQSIKIKNINSEIEKNKTSKNNYSKAFKLRVGNVLETMKGSIMQGHSGGLVATALDKYKEINGQGNTDKNRAKATSIALQEAAKTGIAHFISFNKIKNDFDIVSIKTISDILINDIRDVNIALFQGLIKDNTENWQSMLKVNMNPLAISAVGAYIKKKPDTALFKGYEGAMPFFINAYNATIELQTNALNEKKSSLQGNFSDLFPSLAKNPKITIEMQEKLKSRDVSEFYNLLAETGITNGEIKKVMENITIDSNNISKIASKVAIMESLKWRGKTIDSIQSEFNLTEKDKAFFNTIKSKRLEIDNLTSIERSQAILLLKPNSSLRKYLENLETAESAKGISGESKQAAIESGKNDSKGTAKKLEKGAINRIEKAGEVAKTQHRVVMNEKLVKQNNNPTDVELQRQIQVQKKIDISNQAIAVASYINTPGVSKEDARELVRGITETTSSNTDIDRWIDTQVFISKYVEEKNFVDIIEKNAAYMNLAETKSIGDLYKNSEIDVSHMSSETGSVKLGETNIGLTTLNGMNDLMNCRVEVGDNGVFCRTIRSPEGEVIAKNIPLEFIDDTIEQLGRFYSLGLGKLAPYMKDVGISISKSRPDGITGLDGYNNNEDTKFLKIFAIMLYGEASLPKEMNIPNLVQVFNRTGREYDPKYVLMQKGILQDTGGVNITRLDAELQNSSKMVA